MTIDELKQEFPKIVEKADDIYDIRSLLVVDENYEDEEGDETSEFDTDEYNYMVYITETTQDILGEKSLEKVIDQLSNISEFENFTTSEIDLLGIKTGLDEKSIAKKVLEIVEKELS
jgi:hypothetical protein